MPRAPRAFDETVTRSHPHERFNNCAAQTHHRSPNSAGNAIVSGGIAKAMRQTAPRSLWRVKAPTLMFRTPSIFKLFPLALLGSCASSATPAQRDTLLANEVPTSVTESKSGDFQVDPATELFWSNRISVVLEYWEAESYCAALGHDWRLPTLGELQSNKKPSS